MTRHIIIFVGEVLQKQTQVTVRVLYDIPFPLVPTDGSSLSHFRLALGPGDLGTKVSFPGTRIFQGHEKTR
jgi:hypothetical protein